ncbi:MAG: CsgG/HfaB family protein, partial [Pseudonocardiaceae bacterium]
MVRSLGRTCAVAVLALGSPLHAQEGRTAVFAVLPFENSGSYGQDKEVYQALEQEIPALCASALARHPNARVVEQARVSQGIQTQGLAKLHRVDAATAAKLGKSLGARYVVTGSFADFYGRLRINARVVDAETGEIVKVVSNDDPKLQDRAQLDGIVQAVSEK